MSDTPAPAAPAKPEPFSRDMWAVIHPEGKQPDFLPSINLCSDKNEAEFWAAQFPENPSRVARVRVTEITETL